MNNDLRSAFPPHVVGGPPSGAAPVFSRADQGLADPIQNLSAPASNHKTVDNASLGIRPFFMASRSRVPGAQPKFSPEEKTLIVLRLLEQRYTLWLSCGKLFYRHRDNLQGEAFYMPWREAAILAGLAPAVEFQKSLATRKPMVRVETGSEEWREKRA